MSLFIITGSGLSPGAVAGICIVVFLLVFAAAAAGVFYYRQIPFDLNHLMGKYYNSYRKRQMRFILPE